MQEEKTSLEDQEEIISMNLTLKNNEIPIEIEDEVNFQHLRTS
jgi:hypothetical protein